RETPAGSTCELTWHGQRWHHIQWQLPGLYNVRNAATAATAALLSKTGPAAGQATPAMRRAMLDAGLDLRPLERFRGVKRRQETLVSVHDLLVVEDFGHHPTAIAETLQSFRNRYPRSRLTAVFEPRSNTARTRILQEDFMRALATADDVYLGTVNRAERLSTDERFDRDAVAAFLGGKGITSHLPESNSGLLEELIGNTLKSRDELRVVIFFSNGSFDGIIAKYAIAARAATEA
ncbi:MAG: Mur ligase, partial [Opitutaceae bacterium]|nr:Mur ligase [Opitutaceae bacterium]